MKNVIIIPKVKFSLLPDYLRNKYHVSQIPFRLVQREEYWDDFNDNAPEHVSVNFMDWIKE